MISLVYILKKNQSLRQFTIQWWSSFGTSMWMERNIQPKKKKKIEREKKLVFGYFIFFMMSNYKEATIALLLWCLAFWPAHHNHFEGVIELVKEFRFRWISRSLSMWLCVCLHTHTHICMYVYIYVYVHIRSNRSDLPTGLGKVHRNLSP